MSDDRRSEGLAKLDAILGKVAHLDRLEVIERELAELKEREVARQGSLDAILASMNYCAEAVGTLVAEVAELSKAAAAEPSSDIGVVLRKLAQAVEQNTAAVTQLAAQIAARRGGAH